MLPSLPEIEALAYSWRDILPLLAALDIENYRWKGERRFVVPKGGLAFRSATQLDPLDSLILAAILRRYGDRIERLRIPVAEQRVFSHRFQPTEDGRFYGEDSGWHEFWERSLELANGDKVQAVVVADVTDYYNQVYHHVLENQLREAGLPASIWRSIKDLISHLTQSVSRGLPVGPHAIHLLAEAALDPVDRSMLAHGMEFCRFVDDIHIFCSSHQAALISLHDLAAVLDAQQRLALQSQKTLILPAREFSVRAEQMLKDRPRDEIEAEIIEIIARYSDGNPYTTIDMEDIAPADLEALHAEKLAPLFERHLAAQPVEYSHVRWLLRRLAQLGVPGAVDFVLERIDELAPALGDVARYVLAASSYYEGDWPEAGQRIVQALEYPVIQHSEYIRIVLLHLFARVPELNHLNSLTASYSSATPPIKREILLAARAAGNGAWLRERKAEFETADPWLRRALVASSSAWPGDESGHWVKRVKHKLTFLEKVMLRWASRDRRLNVGQLAIT